MPVPFRFATFWRILRDVDLDAIRRAALQPLELWVVAEHRDDADALVRLLSGGDPAPALRALDVRDVPSSLVALPMAALLVTRHLSVTGPLASARNELRAKVVPVITVVIGETGPAASAPQVGEDARVAVTAIDDGARLPIVSTVLATLGDDRRLALARQLPVFRDPLFRMLTQETSQANASFAFTTGLAESVPVLAAPIALGDIVVLTKNQVLLGYRIVLAAGRSGEPRTLIGEVLGVLGGGLLFRQIAREMVGLIPVAGLPLKVAVAYSGTWAIGRAIALWATEGRAVTSDLVRTLSQEGTERGKAFAQRMLARRPKAQPSGGSPETEPVEDTATQS